MSRYFRGMAIALSLALGVGSVHSTAGVLYENGFESSTVTAQQNGISLGGGAGTGVSSVRAYKGTKSLEFRFDGGPLKTDAWAERRIRFGKPYSEVWVKYDLYVPANYFHRNDSPSNNKFFAIFNNGYKPGYQVNFSMYPSGSGDSLARIHYYKNGREQSSDNLPSKLLFGTSDRGRWHRIVMHFKVPATLSSADGVMRLWKNGESIISVTNLASNGTSGLNYIDEAYILGWSNSGFNETTYMYVDDLVISDSPIDLTEKGGTAMQSPPAAPALRVQ